MQTTNSQFKSTSIAAIDVDHERDRRLGDIRMFDDTGFGQRVIHMSEHFPWGGAAAAQ